MKLKTMLHGLTLMLGCFVLASCVNDEEGPCLPDGKTQVVFSLVLHDNAQTRALWSENSNWINGVDKDNEIDLSSIKLLIFDNTGGFVGSLGSEDLYYLPKNTGTEPYEETVYECIGTVPETISENITSGASYKFVFLANCTNIPTTITWDGINAIPFDSEVDRVPMWGVVTVDNLTLVPGERKDLGKVALLRALSKVTISLKETEGAEGKLDGFDHISSVKVTNYNKKGYVVPTLPAYASVTNTMALDDETCVHENATDAATDLVIEGSTDTKELAFYLLEFVNKEKEADNQTQLIVTLGKTNEDNTVTTKVFDFAPIKFCTYVDGKPSGAPFDIVRNHYYKFNITEVVGGLYVVPTIADWAPAPVLNYDIKMSTNMRLFDSWLYRYDTDGDYTDYTKWATSHMAVSEGRESDGRPSRSPQIQLLTTGVADASVEGSGTFELVIDNTDFEILRANKNDVGVVTSYDVSTNGKLTIAAGEGVYTYFYIVPKVGVTPSNPVAKVSLFYNDPVTGKQEVTYNYNALPGYSDDSSEIWAYYFPAAQYNITGKLKMYYQDANHPLVPTPVQN